MPLGAYWFLMMAPLGAFLPFYALYLGENAELNGSQIGWVFAMLPLVGMTLQPIWGWLSDRSGLRARVLALLSSGAALGYMVIGRADGFAEILLATALLACFSRSLVPMTLAVSLPLLEDHRDAFGWVRAPGTIGFGIVVMSFPLWLDGVQAARGWVAQPGGPSEPGLGLLFPVAAGIAVAAAAVSLAIPNRGSVALRAASGEWRLLLREPRFRRAVLFGMVAFLSLNGPMELFPLLVRHHGGDIHTVRELWLVALVPEFLLITVLGSAAARLGPRRLLAVGLAAGGVRWLLCGVTHSLAWLYVLQTLHAVVVAGLLLGFPLYVDAVVPPQLRSSAQALSAMLAFGIGSAASSVLAGSLLQWGGPTAPYLAGGSGALLLLAVMRWLLPSLRPRSRGD